MMTLSARPRGDVDEIAIRKSTARAQAGIPTPSLTTETVNSSATPFNEVIVAARAAVVHERLIAKARRHFNDADASRALGFAINLHNLVEQQISVIEQLPEMLALLVDVSADESRDSTPHFAARARLILTSIGQ